MASTKRLYALFALLTEVCVSAFAHSYMVDPSSDWLYGTKAECRVGGPEGALDNCPGPCIAPNSPFLNERALETLWRRGQRVRVRWAKNTHRNGFVRLTLVHRRDRMRRSAHTRGAFHFSCFDAHEIACDTRRYHCGTGTRLFETIVTVPIHLPDGPYVLGWAWYGAQDRDEKEGRFVFGDYYSCANIHIRGGLALNRNAVVTRRFIPGRDDDKMRCSAMTDRLGVCSREPCTSKWMYESPRNVRPIGSRPIPPIPSRCDCVEKDRAAGDDIYNFRLIGLGKKGRALNVTRCLCDGSVVDVRKYKYGISVTAETNRRNPRVRFLHNGRIMKIERKAPYAINGNSGRKYKRWKFPLTDAPEFIRAEVLDEDENIVAARTIAVVFLDD